MSQQKPSLSDLRIDDHARSGGSGRMGLAALVLVAAVVAGAALWYGLRAPRAVPVRVAAVVETSASAGGSGPAVLNASGYVTARRRATVSSKMTGKVVDVLVEEGMAVRAGQVLARLDDTTPRRYLELAEAELGASRRAAAETEVRLKEARQTLERARALVRDGISGQADLDRAEAEVDALKARLDLTREQVTVAERQVALRQSDLDDTVIRAPFAGVALSRTPSPARWSRPCPRAAGSRARASRRSSTCRRSRSKWT
jgi:multidrug efflux pump subunit AcrA (membrane-fusion protein)